jgi:ABC-2 type transport system ATP-binding protein
MYVKEYLLHVAGMYKLANPEARVKQMVELTGLGPEQHKRIEQLSKGYRQRVGLAQALVHDPEVLILDEPTSGLDPNQLVDIRNLIREIGQQKTVILSTHIMQEVEALCPRIIIINKGKIVADGSRESLQRGKKGQELVEVELDGAIDVALLRGLNGVLRVEVLSGNRYKVEAQAGNDLRKAIFDLAVKQNRAILSLNVQQSSLEDVFRQLTRS